MAVQNPGSFLAPRVRADTFELALVFFRVMLERRNYSTARAVQSLFYFLQFFARVLLALLTSSCPFLVSSHAYSVTANQWGLIPSADSFIT